MKNNKEQKPNTCYATPNQIAELMKLGYSGMLMLGFFRHLKQVGGIVVPAIFGYEGKEAPKEIDEGSHECSFINDKGVCSLRKEGISLRGCNGSNKIKDGTEWILSVENKGKVNLRKRWLKDSGLAIVKLFMQLSDIGIKKDAGVKENNDSK